MLSLKKVKHGKYDNDKNIEKYCFVMITLKICKNNILKLLIIFDEISDSKIINLYMNILLLIITYLFHHKTFNNMH